MENSILNIRNIKIKKISLGEKSQFLLNRRGMSLIEILIVLAILGGVMTMILSRVFGAKDKASVQQTKLAIGQIMEKLTMYQNDCGHFPESLDGLMKADSSCSNWGPEPYFKTLPTDGWGHPFQYSLNGGEFILKSLGKDNKEGGDGFGKDISNEDVQ